MPRHTNITLAFTLTLAISAQASAQSYEVRAAAGGVNRRSSLADEGTSDAEREGYGFSFPQVGVRGFREGSPHGWLAEVDYVEDPDLDGIFDEAPIAAHDLVVARGGYVYRRAFSLRRHPERRSISLSLHASATVGASLAYGREGTYRPDDSGFVFGARLGVDFDVHLGRFFFGWTVAGEALIHTRGPLDASFRGMTNVIPFSRIGITFGDTVHLRASGDVDT